MTITNQTISLYRGDTKVVTISVVDGNGSAQNLSGASVIFRVNISSGTTLFSKTGGDITLVNVNGTLDGIQFTITAADTEGADGSLTYYHETEVTDGSGNVSTVTTGEFSMRSDLIP